MFRRTDRRFETVAGARIRLAPVRSVTQDHSGLFVSLKSCSKLPVVLDAIVRGRVMSGYQVL